MMTYLHLIERNEIEGTFEDYLLANKGAVLTEIAKSGAVLFRGFDVDTKEAFEKSVQVISPNLRDYIGGDSPREKVGGKVYTSTAYPAEETISMHNEMSYTHSYPRFINFYCEIEPAVGGETPIVDGRVILEKLPSEIVERFKHKKLKYIMNLHDGYGLGKSWKEAYSVETKEEVETILDRPNISYKWKENGMLQVEEIVDPILIHPETGDEAFFSQADQWHPTNLDPDILELMKEIMLVDDFFHNCRYGDDSEIAEADLDTIRDIVNKERVFFKWKKGDVLMMDNLISLHGRAPFSGERSILVTMS